MEFRVLGPLEVTDGGRPISLGAPKQRALLAVLLLHANEVVASERLIDELWGDQPPSRAAKLVQHYVSGLRKVLPAGVLLTRAPGYLLRVEPGELDVIEFERLVEEGRRATAACKPHRGADLYRHALSLWRGPALGDVALESHARREAAALDELRLAAIVERVELELELGRHADLVGELEALVAHHPYQERLRAQLMVALYRSGRQAEALDVYRHVRAALVDDLGLEPSHELQRLERAILTHDPSLAFVSRQSAAEDAGRGTPQAPATADVPSGGRPRLGRRGAAFALLAAGGAVLFAAFLTRTFGDSAPPAIASGGPGIAVLDPADGRVVASVSTGTSPGPIAFGANAVWVGDAVDETLVRVDPATRRVVRTIGLGVPPSDVAVGRGAVWVTSAEAGVLVRVNAETNLVEARIPLGEGGRAAAPISVGGAGIWAGNENAFALYRIDRGANTADLRLRGISPRAIVVLRDELWVLESSSAQLVRLDPATGVIGRIDVGVGAHALAADDRHVWVTDLHDDAVWWIDGERGRLRRTIPVGEDPTRVAVGAGAAWSADTGSDTVTRIDAVTGERTLLRLRAAPRGLVYGAGRLWVTVDPLTPRP